MFGASGVGVSGAGFRVEGQGSRVWSLPLFVGWWWQPAAVSSLKNDYRWKNRCMLFQAGGGRVWGSGLTGVPRS